MKIILNNAIELSPIMVTGAHEYIQGVNRDTLTFVFEDTSVDMLEQFFTEENCKKISLFEETNEYIYNNYVICTKLSKEAIAVAEPMEDGSELTVMKNRVFVTMAQRSYAEQKLAQIAEELLITQLATAELAESMEV